MLGPRPPKVRHSTAMKVNQVLVPTDFSDATAKAVEYAADFAKDHGAELLLCHVLEPSPYPMAPIAGSLERAPAEEALHDAVSKELQQCRDEHVPADANCRTVMLEGQPHTEIIEFAEKEGVELIVMPTHGRSGLAHLLLGSVTEKVIRRAHCPVLVFRTDRA